MPADERFFDELARRAASATGATSVIVGTRDGRGGAQWVGAYGHRDGALAARFDGEPAWTRDRSEWVAVEGGGVMLVAPLYSGSGPRIGILMATFPQKPSRPELIEAALEIFATRAAAEVELRRAAESCRQKEQHYRDVISCISEGIWRVDLDPPVPVDLPPEEFVDRAFAQGRLAEVNAAMARAVGYSVEALDGRRLADVAGMVDRRERVLKVARNGFRPASTEFRTKDRAGGVKWLEAHDVPVIENGTVTTWWGATRDVTARMLAEEQLKESESRYRAVFETAGDAILVLLDGVIQDCNGHALDLFGRSRQEVLGRHMLEFSPEKQRDGQDSARKLQEILARDEEPARFEWQHYRADGAVFDAAVTLSPMLLGGIGHRLALLRDITTQKEHERRIEEWNQQLESVVAERTAQLEAARQELESFSFSVSHDLRAAIRGIQSCSQIVLEEHAARIDEEGRKWLEYIHQDAAQLDKLTLALLDLSRLTRGELRRAEVDLTELARSVAERRAESDPGRRVEWAIAEGMTASGDAVLLRVVMENLIGNAWKFTRARDVASIEVGAAEERGAGPVFFVRDNGVGFDMRQAGRLFGAFQRLHRQEEFEGTGIGLATVRRAIHRHGGRVWAEGAVGKGATIFFTLDTRSAR